MIGLLKVYDKVRLGVGGEGGDVRAFVFRSFTTAAFNRSPPPLHHHSSTPSCRATCRHLLGRT
jgi:hypothetical protein